MQNRQSRMNRCQCWGRTRIILDIEHCPSLAGLIQAECDKMVKFALDQTLLSQFGKPRFSLAEFVKGAQHDVPSLSEKVDA